MYLGIDLGTSAVKVCVMGPDGAVAATTSCPLAVSHPVEGASEQNCADWWDAVCQAVRRLDTGLRRSIRGIGLSGQMHGAVLLDKSGAPIRPALLWNDTRAAAEASEICTAEPMAGDISGVRPMAGFTAPKLLWLSRHAPEDHARIAHILLPKDYIGYRLHGRFVTDPSDAAGTAWLDQRTRRWSTRLCEISATDPDWLPEIRYGTDIAGDLRPATADALGLPPGLPIAVGGGDVAVGAVGIGAVAPGDGFLSVGTSGQLFVTTRHYQPNPGSLIHAYAHTMPDYWFQMAAMLNGARPIAWLAGLLGQPIDDLLTLAETAQPGPVFLPYLTGERTPHGDSDIRGGFAGLSETTTPGALMRAVVEAIAFTFADATAALNAAGTSCHSLLAIGGGARSDLLLQTIANVIGCQIGRSDAADVGPALGAARLARAAEIGGSGTDLFPKPAVTHWVTPDTAQSAPLAKRLAAYRAMYPALKGVQCASR